MEQGYETAGHLSLKGMTRASRGDNGRETLKKQKERVHLLPK